MLTHPYNILLIQCNECLIFSDVLMTNAHSLKTELNNGTLILNMRTLENYHPVMIVNSIDDMCNIQCLIASYWHNCMEPRLLAIFIH